MAPLALFASEGAVQSSVHPLVEVGVAVAMMLGVISGSTFSRHKS